MTTPTLGGWTPKELEQIAADVAAIPAIQERCLANAAKNMKVADRVAHQYQIAGGKVFLQIATELPESYLGVGLFIPGARYTGIGRISTGLGCPHAETSPDFLGLRLAFLTPAGHRVDFIGINDPAAPTDTHVEFMKLLAATAESAGHSTIVSEAVLGISLVRSLGAIRGAQIIGHVTKQTLRTTLSRTAYQTYWTGVVEIGDAHGKCVLAPTRDENAIRVHTSGDQHLTEEWRERQHSGTVEFDLYWIPFIDEQATPVRELMKHWQERRHLLGRVAFPQSDFRSAESQLWAALAAEMGANPGNWVSDRTDSVREPRTEFALARKIAYGKSQEGRAVLQESDYADVFSRGVISEALAAELRRRRELKRTIGHIDADPDGGP